MVVRRTAHQDQERREVVSSNVPAIGTKTHGIVAAGKTAAIAKMRAGTVREHPLHMTSHEKAGATPVNADTQDLVGMIGTRMAGIRDGILVGAVTVGAVSSNRKKERNLKMKRHGARKEFRNHRNHDGTGVPVEAGRLSHLRVKNHNGEGRECKRHRHRYKTGAYDTFAPKLAVSQ